MKSYVIYGISEFSEYVYHTILKEKQADVLCFAVDGDWNAMHKVDKFNGLKVISLENLLDYCKKDDFEMLLTVGYSSMNANRVRAYDKCISLGYKVGTYISTRSVCDSEDIGEGCIMMPMSYIPPVTRVGRCNIINSATIIGHTSIIGDFNWFSGNVTMGGDVNIGSNCFFGMNVLLNNNINIMNETFVGANSYLNESTVQEGRAYMGNPAQNVKGLKSIVVCDFI